jgi:acyl carrier protein
MIKQEIKQIMSKVFDLDIDTISDNAIQKDIIKWDSLNHLNLVVEIEDYYDISIEPEDISEMVSIDQILIIINKYKNV